MNKLKYSFAVILLLSVFIYGIPFYIGEYALRIVLAIIMIILIAYIVRLLSKEGNKSIRNLLLMNILNAIVMLHLGLIFSYLMFEATTTLLIGLVFGSGIYYFIINRIKQLI